MVPTRPQTLRKRRALLRQVRAEIRLTYRDPALDLSDVASAVGASPRQVQRVLAELGQTDFRTTLLMVRMREAERLLRSGHSVRATANRVGYAGPSGLVAAFKRHFGVPPSALRPGPLDYDQEWRTREEHEDGRDD